VADAVQLVSGPRHAIAANKEDDPHELITDVGSVSLFLEPCVEPAEVVFSESHLMEQLPAGRVSRQWDPGIQLGCWWVLFQYFNEYLHSILGPKVGLNPSKGDHLLDEKFQESVDTDNKVHEGVAFTKLLPSMWCTQDHIYLGTDLSTQYFHQGNCQFSLVCYGTCVGRECNHANESRADLGKKQVVDCAWQVLSKIPPWKLHDFSPWKNGLDGVHPTFAKVPSWRRNGFSPGKCEHQHDLHWGNQASCNNGKISKGTHQFELFLDPYLVLFQRWRPPELVIALQQLRGVLSCGSNETVVAFSLHSMIHRNFSVDSLYCATEEFKKPHSSARKWDFDTTLFRPITTLLRHSVVREEALSTSLGIILASCLQYRPWDPGIGWIIAEGVHLLVTAGATDTKGWPSGFRRRFLHLSWSCSALRPQRAIAWGQAMFLGGGNVMSVYGGIQGELYMGRGPAVVGRWHGSLATRGEQPQAERHRTEIRKVSRCSGGLLPLVPFSGGSSPQAVVISSTSRPATPWPRGITIGIQS
jgi:hypothetical protein